MTEYTTSSEAIREYLTARERTARWVTQHYGHDVALLSPSVPPSILTDSDAPSYGPSESEESTNSLPPRMILRWGDGRPDIAIPSSSSNARSRSQSHPHPHRHPDELPYNFVPPLPPLAHPHSHPSAGSHRPSAAPVPSVPSRHAQSLSYASGPFQGPPGQAHSTPPPSPEHIVVLPSPQDEDRPSTAPSASSHVPVSRHGSHHASRTPSAHSVHHPQAVRANGAYPAIPVQQPTIHAPSPRHAYNPSHVPQNPAQSPPMQYTHSQPHPVSHGVYAPSSRAGSNYAPPQIVYSPSHTHRGQAPSITYSHSAPMPATQHHPHGATPMPPNVNPRGIVVDTGRSASRGPRSQSQSRSHAHYERSRSASRSRSPSLSDAGSRTSGSTYYVLPTPGQKVQIIQPGAPSLRTATTATKASQHSPQYSPHSADSLKKPFFQRIFHIPKFAPSVDSRTSSSSSGRKLRRRHTLSVGAHHREHSGDHH